ncbi:hypothetical protein AU184_26690 [Mycolicibacterium novocastrense]|uniref:Rieske (2Fe-2S) protein n=1 Tax=Mycolicibacterium novocastrense TaxID=59813 RepID=UPI000746F93F|nr:Rieske 2Fe-2S domain-containing protein [Mycolicibacterium novocastrense]KUH68075.1 hypothetical protein AU183_04480 [Mycolicibacterium novocastrense]KUH68684.1 hypothetical protein AU184_26690 [Mycolicibacterium novocastrense]KUH74375.1 hypothetical protein AU072_17275 [Mycolicibacterium novocastrense]
MASLDEIAIGELTPFTVDDEEIVVLRRDDGIYAINNICTHAEAYLDMGEYHAETLEVECPLHVGRFSLRDGTATVAPCVIPVRSYAISIVGNDVMVELPGRLP